MATPGSELPGYSDRGLTDFQLAVMGDLHLAPEQMKLFEAARKQLVAAMTGPDGKLMPGARVAQLGDLGHSKHAPGSRRCFEYARDFLSGFGVQYALVLGNHDLEGQEFETDEDNLRAWSETFGQPHYWAADLGRARLVGLSTTRFRSNENSHHEVYICQEQIEWLEAQLAAHPDRPFIVLTHAPPMGCGLKVLQEIHVKNRCAWLNHSAEPRVFVNLVSRHPNVKLWFSGHFHLSHNYPDSISTVGTAAFVQTGVIGACHRDGYRQSRLLRGTSEGYQLLTVDHEDGQMRLDMEARWDDASAPVPSIPDDELICDASAGWLCSQLDCKVGDNIAGYMTWYAVGSKTILALQDDLLVEYDMATSAPIGLVTRVPNGCSLQLLDAQGRPAVAEDGSDVATIRVLEEDGMLREDALRNAAGCFYRIYQPNKWRLKKKAEADKAAAMVVA